MSEWDQNFDLDSVDEPNLCLLQVRSEIVSKPLVSSTSVNFVKASDVGVVPEPPLVSPEVASAIAPVATAQETPLRTKLEQGWHGKGQGPIELLSTKRQTTLVVGGVSLGAAPNQIVCLLVALAIPILFLLAYQFVLYPPDGSRYESRHSNGATSPGYQGYNDGRRRSGGGTSGGPTMQSPISSYRVTSAQAGQGTSRLVLGIPRALVPVAQEARIDVVNLGADGSTILSAVVSERKGRPGIWLLAASQAPVAWLDTSQALLDGGDLADPTPRRGQNEAERCVVLHRAQNGGGSWMPSAWGGPPAPPNAPFAVLALTRNEAGGTLVAQRYSGGSQSGGNLLTVSLTPHGEVVAINDAQGAVLATAEPGAARGSPSGSVKGSARLLLDSQAGNPSHTVVAVSSSADVVLVVAAVISAQKLHPHFSF